MRSFRLLPGLQEINLPLYMPRFLTAILLLIYLYAPAQIDQQKLDSLKRSIDSNTRAVKSWQDSFQKNQDSLYRSRIMHDTLRTNTATDTRSLMEHEKRKKMYLRLLVTVILVLALAYILLGRKKVR
jgi:accessory gene regulator protein AgrB